MTAPPAGSRDPRSPSAPLGPPRRQAIGPDAIRRAIEAGALIPCVLLLREDASPEAVEAAALAERHGARVHLSSKEELWRLTAGSPPADVLGLIGAQPDVDLPTALGCDGPAWLLCGVAYPGNAGFAIRTAEVSGACAIALDNDFGPRDRRKALRASMGADRFFPVYWEPAETVVEAAREAGRRLVVVEDVGASAPWETDLTGPILFAVGGEHDGVPSALIEAADSVVRVPMRGFVPSHNLQAAMSVVLGERLRQAGAAPESPSRSLSE